MNVVRRTICLSDMVENKYEICFDSISVCTVNNQRDIHWPEQVKQVYCYSIYGYTIRVFVSSHLSGRICPYNSCWGQKHQLYQIKFKKFINNNSQLRKKAWYIQTSDRRSIHTLYFSQSTNTTLYIYSATSESPAIKNGDLVNFSWCEGKQVQC